VLDRSWCVSGGARTGEESPPSGGEREGEALAKFLSREKKRERGRGRVRHWIEGRSRRFWPSTTRCTGHLRMRTVFSRRWIKEGGWVRAFSHWNGKKEAR